MISEKAMRLSSAGKIAGDLQKWRNGEHTFYNLFPLMAQTSEKDNIDHSDFEFDAITGIDIKGLKKSHKHGFVLLEFRNVQGRNGWCSQKSKAKFYAFQFQEYFLIVAKHDLLEWCKENLPPFEEPEERKNGNGDYEKLLYTYCGRLERKDVFTYIRESDLESIPHVKWPY